MNSNLMKLMKDIEQDQARVNAKKDAAKRTVVEEINKLIAAFDIKAGDLDFGAQRRGRPAVKAEPVKVKRPRKNAGRKIEPKYQAPDGTTWTGRGLKPKGIQAALDAGFTLEDMLIKKEPAAADAS